MEGTRINREAFLRQLELTAPGLASGQGAGGVEQAGCYVFRKGHVLTYNEEVACRAPSGLDKGFTGAVPAGPLVEILKKLRSDELEVRNGQGELVLIGKAERTGIRLEAEITLPFGEVEKPQEWKPLHKSFCDAATLIGQCGSNRKDADIRMVCAHVHPEWVEACDTVQFCRWTMHTYFAEACLVRHSSLKHAALLGMAEFSESEAWIHFRGPAGVVLSCHKYLEEYPDLSELTGVEGEKVALPKGLAEAADAADVFSRENEANVVEVDLRPGKVWIRAVGVNGWYRKPKTVKYRGRRLRFLIAPAILQDIVRRHDSVEVSERKLVARSGSYVYVTSLNLPAGEESAANAADAADGKA